MSSSSINDVQKAKVLEKKKLSKTKTKGVCVVLEDDFDKHKIEDLLLAICQLKGVAQADWIDYNGFEDYCNRSKIKLELKQKLRDVLG